MPDLSKATQLAYEKRFYLLSARFEKETIGQGGSAPKLVRFVNWLVAQRSALRPATWRQYRAATCFRLKTAATPHQMPRIEKLLAKLYVADTQEAQEARKALGARTSAKKLKNFKAEDQEKIFAHLASMPTRNSEVLRLYLISGLLTGLRPAEWQDVTIERVTPLTLRVRNAKYDEVRGNGEFRDLTFDNIEVATQTDLYAWIGVAHAGDYPKLQGRLADALRAVNRAIWPRRNKNLTMYSTRHEFAAVAKLALAGNREASARLAALMGHASDVTACNHYGRYGSRKVLPEYLAFAIARLPSSKDEEVASVRRKLEGKKSFLRATHEQVRSGR